MHYLMPRKNPLREITANQLAEQIGELQKKMAPFFWRENLDKKFTSSIAFCCISPMPWQF
jgi:hypothetical protein